MNKDDEQSITMTHNTPSIIIRFSESERRKRNAKMNLRQWIVLLVRILGVALLLSPSPAQGFPAAASQPHSPATTTTSVRIEPVQTDEDWNALADVRFDEWIQDDGRTSRQAFRSATRDLYREERPSSLLFLAKQSTTTTTLGNDHHDSEEAEVKVVGAAEMSSYEVEAAVISKDNHEDDSSPLPRPCYSALYVTDVVTDSKFRRQGIARKLMQGLEDHAAAMGTTHLVLNVAHENASAIRFYGIMGYRDAQGTLPLDFLDGFLDVPMIEELAGTTGQMMLGKTLVNIASSRSSSSSLTKKEPHRNGLSR